MEKQIGQVEHSIESLFELVGGQVMGVEIAENGDGSIIESIFIVVRRDNVDLKIEVSPDKFMGLKIKKPVQC